MKIIPAKVSNELTISDYTITEKDLRDIKENFNGIQITVSIVQYKSAYYAIHQVCVYLPNLL